MDGALSTHPPALPNQNGSISKATNTVLLYAISGQRHALECFDQMIDIARPANLPISDTIQGGSMSGSFRLITKYYSVSLNLKMINVGGTEDCDTVPHESGRVMIVILSADDAAKLKPLLSQLDGNDVELSIVIVTPGTESQKIDPNFWEEVCSPFGFECYDYEDIAEASMALQCFAWFNLKKRGPADLPDFDTSFLTKPGTFTITKKHTSQFPVIPSSDPQWTMSASTTDPPCYPAFDPSHTSSSIPMAQTLGEADPICQQFDDDFLPFVSAQTGGTNFSSFTTLDKEDFSTTEWRLDEVEALIFGQRKPHDQPKATGNPCEVADEAFDLSDILVRLQSLKASVQRMNDGDRKRLAASVALVVERKLEFG